VAMLGKLRAQIIEEKIDDIGQQFELLTEAMPNIKTYPVSNQTGLQKKTKNYFLNL
jgi:hypothetical protein